jgi:hypothetical protein
MSKALIVRRNEPHPPSVAVSREHPRAKTDRLDTELLKRGFLGVAAWGTGPLQHGARREARCIA